MKTSNHYTPLIKVFADNEGTIPVQDHIISGVQESGTLHNKIP
jgi:hypothetical protein